MRPRGVTLEAPSKSLFMTRFFELMDTSHNGGIDFIEFVVAMWNFCTLTPRALT